MGIRIGDYKKATKRTFNMKLTNECDLKKQMDVLLAMHNEKNKLIF